MTANPPLRPKWGRCQVVAKRAGQRGRAKDRYEGTRALPQIVGSIIILIAFCGGRAAIGPRRAAGRTELARLVARSLRE
jgi:hypothetical protein